MSVRAPAGRPLIFFCLILGGWIMGRIALFIPGAPAPVAHAAPVAAPIAGPRWAMAAQATALIPPLPHQFAAPAAQPDAPSTSRSTPPDATVDLLDFIHFTMAFANRHHAPDVEPGGRPPMLAPAPLPAFPGAPALSGQPGSTDRWRASAWLLWRPDRAGAAAVASAGQLGASQAGARIDFDIVPSAPHRIAGYARVSRALVRPAQPEAAIGIAVQPARRLPVSLALERRIALGEGGRNAMAAMVVGGFGPAPVVAGVIAEGYGQAGVVGLKARDGFVDGRVALMKPVAGTGAMLGGVLSGGAQPAVHRIDVGPALQVRLPIAPASGRLMLEWRERVAGRAYPRSGLALTLAADF